MNNIFSFSKNPPYCRCDANMFPLSKPDVNLFDTTAKLVAEELSTPEILKKYKGEWQIMLEKKANAPTQIRRFYDEVTLWSEKTKTTEAFDMNLPFIKMMNAKVAYAKGRELVDDKFQALFSVCLGQITEADEENLKKLHNFRNFLEAVVGFYKVARPK